MVKKSLVSHVFGFLSGIKFVPGLNSRLADNVGTCIWMAVVAVGSGARFHYVLQGPYNDTISPSLHTTHISLAQLCGWKNKRPSSQTRLTQTKEHGNIHHHDHPHALCCILLRLLHCPGVYSILIKICFKSTKFKKSIFPRASTGGGGKGSFFFFKKDETRKLLIYLSM